MQADSVSAGGDVAKRAWLRQPVRDGLLRLAAVTALAGWLLPAPAAAQNSIYGFGSSYNVFVGQGAGGGQQRHNRASNTGVWRPGAANVYPPGQVYEAPRPPADIGGAYGGTYASAGGSGRVVGGAYGSAGGVYGTVPPGSAPPGTVRSRGNITVNAYGAGRNGAPVPAATVQPVAVEADVYDDPALEDDAAPLPIYRANSGGKGVDPKFDRHLVRYTSSDPAGTIIVDTGARYLYLVQGDGTALRYGIGVGREGFAWSGSERVTDMREWPDWRPPPEMVERRPDLPNVMPGGPDNPLGARALYLGKTLYRIHGSNEPESIGQAVSSGCIRMRNQDVIDLYDRVKVGTLVRVI
ncbi:L,D-transpeptidase [Ancylobacter sp. VNQ12]|uniref:L,D-transpeptidase n=1 Tax=Ancylobacter sp. VNQ12 TaxID=3400920 RepID=UPI003BFCE3DF